MNWIDTTETILEKLMPKDSTNNETPVQESIRKQNEKLSNKLAEQYKK